MRRRAVLSTLAVLALLALFGAAGGLARAEEAGAPRSLGELRKLLDGLAQRLGRVAELAARHGGHRILERYLAYGEEDWKNRKRPVEAEDLVALMSDATAPEKLREAARDALAGNKARTFDPDLLERVGQRRPRLDFARRHLVPLVKEDDPIARKLANDLLLRTSRRATRTRTSASSIRPGPTRPSGRRPTRRG